MVLVLGILGLAQLVEFAVCGVSLFTLISLVAKILFSCRIFCKVFKTSHLATVEFAGYLLWVLWSAVGTRGIKLSMFIVFTLCMLVSIIVYIIDNDIKVYVIGDDD